MISLPSKFIFFLVLNIFSAKAFDCEITLVDGSPNQILTAHCQSNGRYLGNATMDPYVTASFLAPVVDNQRIVATCDMALGSNLRGNFQVFDSDEDRERCTRRALDWRVDENGLYVLIDHAFVQRHRWPQA